MRLLCLQGLLVLEMCRGREGCQEGLRKGGEEGTLGHLQIHNDRQNDNWNDREGLRVLRLGLQGLGLEQGRSLFSERVGGAWWPREEKNQQGKGVEMSIPGQETAFVFGSTLPWTQVRNPPSRK